MGCIARLGCLVLLLCLLALGWLTRDRWLRVVITENIMARAVMITKSTRPSLAYR